MKVEFGQSCNTCERRPACEVAAQRYKKIEKAAKDLGFAVTEGSIICEGKESLPEPFDPMCKVGFSAPRLASEQERERIMALEGLDDQLKEVLPSTQALILSVEG